MATYPMNNDTVAPGVLALLPAREAARYGADGRPVPVRPRAIVGGDPTRTIAREDVTRAVAFDGARARGETPTAMGADASGAGGDAPGLLALLGGGSPEPGARNPEPGGSSRALSPVELWEQRNPFRPSFAMPMGVNLRQTAWEQDQAQLALATRRQDFSEEMGRAGLALDIYKATRPTQRREPMVLSLPDSSGRSINFAWDGANLQRIDERTATTAPEPGTGGVRAIDVPGVGKVVVDAQTNVPLDASKVVRPQRGGRGLDPLVVGSLTQQITALEQERAQHQAAIVSGDERTGFANRRSRKSRVAEIDAKLAGLRAMLEAGGDGAGVGPGTVPGPESRVASAPAAISSTSTTPAKLYTVGADRQLSFAPDVKTPQQVLQAFNQMVQDGVMDVATARAELEKRGFKRNEQKR